jgi:hypothetical protein
MQYFTYNWSDTFTIHVLYFIKSLYLLSIKPQLKQNEFSDVLHLNRFMHGQVWSWTITSLQRSRGCYERFDRHKNFAIEVSFHLLLEPNNPGCFNAPTDKLVTVEVRRTWGLYFKNELFAEVYWYVSFNVGNLFLKYVQLNFSLTLFYLKAQFVPHSKHFSSRL